MSIDERLLSDIRNNTFAEKTLFLANESLSDEDVTLLVSALEQNAYVKELNLSGNSITSKGAQTLATLGSLEILDVASNSIDAEGARVLAQSKLKKLNISANPIGDAVSYFSSTPSLVELSARECGITDQGARELFLSNSIKNLDLGTNELQGTCLKDLASNEVLEHLCLMQNPLSREYCSYFSSNRTLNSLDLTNVVIGDFGAASIAKSKTLKQVVLSQCAISDAGAIALSENTSIRILVLFNNRISTTGANALAKNNHLTYLNLENNNFIDTPSELTQRYVQGIGEIFTRDEAFIVQLLKRDLEEDYHRMVTPESSPDQVAAAVMVDPHYLPFFLHATQSAKENFLDSLQQGIGIKNKRQKMEPTTFLK